MYANTPKSQFTVNQTSSKTTKHEYARFWAGKCDSTSMLIVQNVASSTRNSTKPQHTKTARLCKERQAAVMWPAMARQTGPRADSKQTWAAVQVYQKLTQDSPRAAAHNSSPRAFLCAERRKALKADAIHGQDGSNIKHAAARHDRHQQFQASRRAARGHPNDMRGRGKADAYS